MTNSIPELIKSMSFDTCIKPQENNTYVRKKVLKRYRMLDVFIL